MGFVTIKQVTKIVCLFHLISEMVTPILMKLIARKMVLLGIT